MRSDSKVEREEINWGIETANVYKRLPLILIEIRCHKERNWLMR